MKEKKVKVDFLLTEQVFYALKSMPEGLTIPEQQKWLEEQNDRRLRSGQNFEGQEIPVQDVTKKGRNRLKHGRT